MIFNFHFTGSPLWDLFSREAVMLENSWHTSARIMFDIPLQTHKYLIEPLTETKHLKKVLLTRFISFLDQIEKSRKCVTKQLLSFIKRDTRSTTGSNLRNLLLLTNKHSINELKKDDINQIKYNEINKEDEWKVNFIKEIIDIKANQIEVENFSYDELDEILNHLCTS